MSKQTEFAGADDFNLSAEVVAAWVGLPAKDEATGDLFACGPVEAWVTKAAAEREAVEAKRRRDEERAEAIRADLAKPKETWTRRAIIEQIEAQDLLIAKLNEKVRIAEGNAAVGTPGADAYFHFLAADLSKAMQEREAAKAALVRFE